MCERCGQISDGPTGRSGRLRMWEFPDNAQCPLIGTCLSHDDLIRITRKLGLRIDRHACDYDVHGYFVQKGSQDCPESRAIHKLLDARHAGALRRVARARSPEELGSLWREMKESGRIAAAFYAFMTLRHVPQAFRAHVFGEIHMMSHLMGASHRDQSRKVAELKASLVETEIRRQRVEAGFHSALAERDARIEDLEAEIIALRARSGRQAEARADCKAAPSREKVRRALETARGRARAAEAEAAALGERLRRVRDARRRTASRPAPTSGTQDPAGPDVPRLNGNAILFLGGRNRQISHLRRLASEYGAVLLHHDGGLEDAATRIDDMLPSVDCVFCPVDCVSHDACLRAKDGCRKFGKTFVPLRNASKASLRQGLMMLAQEQRA